MWHDPYQGGWGERTFAGLLALLAAILGLKVLAWALTPLIPMLVTAVVVSGLLLWILRHRSR